MRLQVNPDRTIGEAVKIELLWLLEKAIALLLGVIGLNCTF
ncbi:hypothetical protein [Nostoc sp. DedQUE07]|nr:hypothetical protein [Nostoc sp. DedQUE07]MDZ8128175.1 hypothetical protein [Nostoc sp. DedQUE07]